MAFIEWEEKYNLNIKEVDDQHQHLMDLLNKLYDSVVSGAERTVLGETLDDLIQYTVEHFQTEEDLFETFQYPHAESHRKEHNDLTRAVIELQEQFKEGSATISFEVLDFLRNWLIDHTLGSDQKFGPYFNQKGIF